ncbi:MAG: hypothetical protein Q6363_008035 [Candidatus Njordarchaeota archaeon]
MRVNKNRSKEEVSGLKFLMVDVNFPSVALLKKRITWYQKIGGERIRIGLKIYELLPRPFINKLQNLYNDFLEEYNKLTLSLWLTSEMKIRVIPKENIVAFHSLIDEYTKKLQELSDNIVMFIVKGDIDPLFLRAYKEKGEETVDYQKLRSDIRDFKHKINLLVDDIIKNIQIKAKAEGREAKINRKAIIREILDKIIEKAKEIPKRFEFLLLPVSFEMSVLLGSSKYKTVSEVRKRASNKLLRMFEESKQKIVQAYRSQLVEVLEKVVWAIRNGLPTELLLFIKHRLEDFRNFPVISKYYDIFLRMSTSKDQPPKVEQIFKILDEMWLAIIKKKEDILRRASKEVLQAELKRQRTAIKQEIETLKDMLEYADRYLKNRIRDALSRIKNIAKTVGDVELLDAIKSLESEEQKIEAVAMVTKDIDPEIASAIRYIVAKKKVFEQLE